MFQHHPSSVSLSIFLLRHKYISINFGRNSACILLSNAMFNFLETCKMLSQPSPLLVNQLIHLVSSPKSNENLDVRFLEAKPTLRIVLFSDIFFGLWVRTPDVPKAYEQVMRDGGYMACNMLKSHLYETVTSFFIQKLNMWFPYSEAIILYL